MNRTLNVAARGLLREYRKKNPKPLSYFAELPKELREELLTVQPQCQWLVDIWLQEAGSTYKEIYCTSFCNHGHYVRTGKPVDHECYTIPPAALQAEMNGIYDHPGWESMRRSPR